MYKYQYIRCKYAYISGGYASVYKKIGGDIEDRKGKDLKILLVILVLTVLFTYLGAAVVRAGIPVLFKFNSLPPSVIFSSSDIVEIL